MTTYTAHSTGRTVRSPHSAASIDALVTSFERDEEWGVILAACGLPRRTCNRILNRLGLSAPKPGSDGEATWGPVRAAIERMPEEAWETAADRVAKAVSANLRRLPGPPGYVGRDEAESEAWIALLRRLPRWPDLMGRYSWPAFCYLTAASGVRRLARRLTTTHRYTFERLAGDLSYPLRGSDERFEGLPAAWLDALPSDLPQPDAHLP